MCEQIPTDIFISKNQNPNPGSGSEGGKQQNVSQGKRTITTCQNVKQVPALIQQKKCKTPWLHYMCCDKFSSTQNIGETS